MTKQMRKRKYTFAVLPPVDKKLLQEFRENADEIYPAKVVPCDDMRLEIGYGLIPLVEEKLKYNLQARIRDIRRQFVKEYGFQFPTIRILDNQELNENEYRFYIKGKKAGGYKIPKNKYICLTWNWEKNKDVNEIQGKEIKDPVFGVPAFLISKSNVEQYFNNGHTIADAPCIIATHISKLIKSNFAEIFTYNETKNVLSLVKKKYPALLTDVLNFYKVTEINEILKNILREKKSIARIEKILEILINNNEIKDKGKLMKIIFKGIK